MTVSDGGHLAIGKWFKDHMHLESVCNGTELTAELRKTEILELHPLFVSAGDIAICHSLLPHGVSTNNGPVRPVLYLRYGIPITKGFTGLSQPWLGWKNSFVI